MRSCMRKSRAPAQAMPVASALQAPAARFELLEIAVVLLIVTELVLGIIRH